MVLTRNNKSRANGKKDDHRSPTRKEYSAGGIVFRRVGRTILIGLVKDSYDKWTFAKGHVEKGETPVGAALREVSEEMGLKNLRSLSYLGTATLHFKDHFHRVGEIISKDVFYFLMEAPSGDRGRPENKKTGERIKAIRWVPARDLLRSVGYKNMTAIVKKALSLIDIYNRRF
jgi:8-oxo-dGTP diphosphatase